MLQFRVSFYVYSLDVNKSHLGKISLAPSRISLLNVGHGPTFYFSVYCTCLVYFIYLFISLFIVVVMMNNDFYYHATTA